ENVRAAFWPGTVAVSVAAAAPGVMVSVASGGTSYSVSVIDPVVVVWGSTKIAYVPVVGSVLVSTNPPAVVMSVGDTSLVLSGLMIETFACVIVDAILRLI